MLTAFKGKRTLAVAPLIATIKPTHERSGNIFLTNPLQIILYHLLNNLGDQLTRTRSEFELCRIFYQK